MAKGLLGGMTDYSHQSFADIINDLQSEQRNLSVCIDKIEENLKTLIDNGFWETHVISNFRSQIWHSIKHYKTAVQEINEISTEIQIEVKEHHCKRLQKISDVANDINVNIGKIWNQDYDDYKDYDDPNFLFVEEIYVYARDMAVNLLDFDNIAVRLTDFIGKQNSTSVVTKKKPKLELSHKIALFSVAIALIVMLFGNNIIGRLNTNQKNPKENIDTTNLNNTTSDTTNNVTLFRMELPYLNNIPIIDKGLFIKYYYNDFVLGGVNIDTISINARSKTGESVKLRSLNNEIQIDITKEPYIELEYKGIFYSIEIIGKHYSISCILKKITSPTLILKKYNEVY